ncbi:MAG: hypothetical protein GWP10_11095 [Nitrospiraceae bacterium]|nr:hypothetical protein [Nitrospiraceae bacterium]
MENHEKYVKILKENHMKVTPQRIDILKYLEEHMTHPSAEKIYSDLKKKNPSLSKTTVYNTLEALGRHHIIQILTISGSELRYDFRTTPHHHFMCTRCGAIIDIDVDCPYLGKFMGMGHRIDEMHGYFKGVCKDCLEKERRETK